MRENLNGNFFIWWLQRALNFISFFRAKLRLKKSVSNSGCESGGGGSASVALFCLQRVKLLTAFLWLLIRPWISHGAPFVKYLWWNFFSPSLNCVSTFHFRQMQYQNKLFWKPFCFQGGNIFFFGGSERIYRTFSGSSGMKGFKRMRQIDSFSY